MRAFLNDYHKKIYGKALPYHTRPIHELYARLPNSVLKVARKAAYKEIRLSRMYIFILH